MIFTDQGRNFESRLFQELCKGLLICKAKTAPYRPSVNGQVERYNRTLMDAEAVSFFLNCFQSPPIKKEYMTFSRKMMYMYLVEGFQRRTTQATTDPREFLKGSVVVKGGGNAVYDVYVNDPGNREHKQIKKVLAMDPDRYFGIRDGICDELNLKVTVSLKSKVS